MGKNNFPKFDAKFLNEGLTGVHINSIIMEVFGHIFSSKNF